MPTKKLALFLLWPLLLCGCGPSHTYPAAGVPDAVEEITRKEYQMDVKARVVGKTLGALIFADSAMSGKQVSKDVNEKMGKVMQVLTRVALSTDLEIDFCVVVLRDRVNLADLIIVRSVDDTKRANAEMIGIEESINRTVFGQTHWTPTAAPDDFVLKEVKLQDFLADQMVQRIRFSFVKDLKDESLQPLILADGGFEADGENKSFQFSVIALKKEEGADPLINAFTVIDRVLDGYRFNDFRRVEIKDYAGRKKLTVPRHVFGLYRDKKLSLDEIMERYASTFDVTMDAFKLFGINFSQDASSQTPAPELPAAE